jgi:hypothetical protein
MDREAQVVVSKKLLTLLVINYSHRLPLNHHEDLQLAATPSISSESACLFRGLWSMLGWKH